MVSAAPEYRFLVDYPKPGGHDDDAWALEWSAVAPETRPQVVIRDISAERRRALRRRLSPDRAVTLPEIERLTAARLSSFGSPAGRGATVATTAGRRLARAAAARLRAGWADLRPGSVSLSPQVVAGGLLGGLGVAIAFGRMLPRRADRRPA